MSLNQAFLIRVCHCFLYRDREMYRIQRHQSVMTDSVDPTENKICFLGHADDFQLLVVSLEQLCVPSFKPPVSEQT